MAEYLFDTLDQLVLIREEAAAIYASLGATQMEAAGLATEIADRAMKPCEGMLPLNDLGRLKRPLANL